MALAIVYSRANLGIDAPLVTVEVHLSNGLPAFNIVGLPETVVKESRERVRSAILNSQLEFPQRRITINLAPADLPKTGGRFDLAIAIGILAASRQMDRDRLQNLVIMGELALSGEVRRVNGILPGLIACSREQRYCIIPAENSAEAGLLEHAGIGMCSHLLQVLNFFHNKCLLPKPELHQRSAASFNMDFSDVIGQESMKRALILAAAGGHNLLMRGPPGTGKTMLASRLVTILPPLSQEQALEVAAIQSISRGTISLQDWNLPPFRTPHHTSSSVALVGGGTTLNTGEITLAHHGVLFLDELPEFSPKALEVLREPLEAGCIQISRTRYQVRLPASFQLVAAMNPCPCGHHGEHGEGSQHCRCTPERVKQYRQRISGPLMDRIDLQVEVPRLSQSDRNELLQQKRRENLNSAAIREQVIACRTRQIQRNGCCNARLQQHQLQDICRLQDKNNKLLADAIERLRLSTRGYFRILKIARTIADLAEVDEINSVHLLEAINYRRFDSGN